MTAGFALKWQILRLQIYEKGKRVERAAGKGTQSMCKMPRHFRELCTSSFCPFQVPWGNVYLGATHCYWSSLFLLKTMYRATCMWDLPAHGLKRHACGNIPVLPRIQRQVLLPHMVGWADHVELGSLRTRPHTPTILKKKIMFLPPTGFFPLWQLCFIPSTLFNQSKGRSHSQNTICLPGRLLLSS